MQSFVSALIAALSVFPAIAAVVTNIHYVTQVSYEEVDVLVDGNGEPFSTVTVTRDGGLTSASAVATAASTNVAAASAETSSSTSQAPPAAPSTSSASAETSNEDYSIASSHSHNPVNNYAFISSVELFTSTTAAPAPSTSNSTSQVSPPAPTATAPAPTTTSTAPASTTRSASLGGDFSGDATYYDVGLGACGETDSDSDLIAALNVQQFNSFGSMSNGNPVCSKKAKINYQGKTVTVSITDKCPGCAYGDLDLSPAAFETLADKSAGRIHINWSFV